MFSGENNSQRSSQRCFQLQNRIWEKECLRSSQPVWFLSGQVGDLRKHPSSGLTSGQERVPSFIRDEATKEWPLSWSHQLPIRENKQKYPFHCFRTEDKQVQPPQPYFLPSTAQPCHLFCFGAKRPGGKREISQKKKQKQTNKQKTQTKRRKWRLGEQCSLPWVPERDTLNLAKRSPTQFHPLQRHQQVSELSISPIPRIWSGTDERVFNSCLSFISLPKLGMVGWFPFLLPSFFWLLFPFPFDVCAHERSVLFCFSLLVLIAVRWQCPFTAWRSNVPSVE